MKLPELHSSMWSTRVSFYTMLCLSIFKFFVNFNIIIFICWVTFLHSLLCRSFYFIKVVKGQWFIINCSEFQTKNISPGINGREIIKTLILYNNDTKLRYEKWLKYSHYITMTQYQDTMEWDLHMNLTLLCLGVVSLLCSVSVRITPLKI
jgi:hypothetical protein